MNLLRRIGCLFGRHHRSKRHAKLVGETSFSKCTYCGAKMRQVGNKQWVVEKAT